MAKERTAKPPRWVKLDNAAKIYPAARSRLWTPIFRLSLNMDETVDRGLLQRALENTLKRIPLFGYRLRHGLFWYYLDSQRAVPQAEDDVRNPCARMRLKRGGHFLFRVRVHDCRIAVEIFHSLADGTGGLTFLMTLAAEYVRLKYGPRVPESDYILDVRKQPLPSEWEDSFLVHARGGAISRREERAYALTGTKLMPGNLLLTTGLIQTDALKRTAHKFGATVNVFLCAVLLKALLQVQKEDRRAGRKRRPVKLSIPINLRKYYPSRTLRNFSSYFNASVNPTYGEYSLEDLIKQVKYSSLLEGTEQRLNARMSTNVAAEENKFIRAMPLFVKTAVLKMMYSLTGEKYFTTTLSNLGSPGMPEALGAHVARADFILGPAKHNKLACGVISAGGLTSVSFSRTVEESLVERCFFTELVRLGVHVKVESNRR